MSEMNRADIEAAIPHRDPFLFLDTVEECNDDGLVATWRVPRDADWFRGHYPGQPVTPGCLISEHAFQAAAVHIARALGGLDPSDGVPILTKIEGARFRRMVAPGDELSTTVSVRERVGPAWYMKAVVRSGGAKVADLTYVLSAAEAISRTRT